MRFEGLRGIVEFVRSIFAVTIDYIMKSINKLQQKWGVGPVQFWLIMTTFALGGSLSGYLNKQILNLVFLEKNAAEFLIHAYKFCLSGQRSSTPAKAGPVSFLFTA